MTSVDEFIENYKNLIYRIQSTGFKARYFILSPTPMREDMQVAWLSNKLIMEANAKLKAMCAANGWTYVDVASHLRDSNNNLLLKYSDGTKVHLLKAAYAFWDEALANVAIRLMATPTPAPTPSPSPTPTATPTAAPTATPEPTAAPTAAPTEAPTEEPTETPTEESAATDEPTAAPTEGPTESPTQEPE